MNSHHSVTQLERIADAAAILASQKEWTMTNGMVFGDLLDSQDNAVAMELWFEALDAIGANRRSLQHDEWRYVYAEVEAGCRLNKCQINEAGWSRIHRKMGIPV